MNVQGLDTSFVANHGPGTFKALRRLSQVAQHRCCRMLSISVKRTPSNSNPSPQMGDLDLAVVAKAVATVREPDGLAMRSRNRFRPDTANARNASESCLRLVENRVAAGERSVATLEQTMANLHRREPVKLDYAEVRDAAICRPWLPSTARPLRHWRFISVRRD